MSVDINLNKGEPPSIADKNAETREPLQRFNELAPALRIYEKNLLLRIDELEQKLQANTMAIQTLEEHLLQELSAIKQAQATHAETLISVDKIVRRGLWLRRLRAIIGWLLLIAIAGGAVYIYYFFNWNSLLSMLI
jgi:flagellar biosynthesis regulator FlaF